MVDRTYNAVVIDDDAVVLCEFVQVGEIVSVGVGIGGFGLGNHHTHVTAVGHVFVQDIQLRRLELLGGGPKKDGGDALERVAVQLIFRSTYRHTCLNVCVFVRVYRRVHVRMYSCRYY